MSSCVALSPTLAAKAGVLQKKNNKQKDIHAAYPKFMQMLVLFEKSPLGVKPRDFFLTGTRGMGLQIHT